MQEDVITNETNKTNGDESLSSKIDALQAKITEAEARAKMAEESRDKAINERDQIFDKMLGSDTIEVTHKTEVEPDWNAMFDECKAFNKSCQNLTYSKSHEKGSGALPFEGVDHEHSNLAVMQNAVNTVESAAHRLAKANKMEYDTALGAIAEKYGYSSDELKRQLDWYKSIISIAKNYDSDLSQQESKCNQLIKQYVDWNS